MNREFDDDELDELLEEEYIKEADFIEASLMAKKKQNKLSMTDQEVKASYLDLVDRLKAQGLYREDDEMPVNETEEEDDSVEQSMDAFINDTFEKKILPISDLLENPKRTRMVYHHRMIKAAIIAGCCLLGALAVSMSDRQSKEYVIENADYFAYTKILR